ncbi:MAG: hypothetical protein ACOYIE_05930 [Agathobaculum sp.]|jgi:hypothetical protein|uniref:hypothetical protein n=1 Tax=Agathobaculum sp. TaxID=2048138 RepID=UPI003D92CC30
MLPIFSSLLPEKNLFSLVCFSYFSSKNVINRHSTGHFVISSRIFPYGCTAANRIIRQDAGLPASCFAAQAFRRVKKAVCTDKYQNDAAASKKFFMRFPASLLIQVVYLEKVLYSSK